MNKKQRKKLSQIQTRYSYTNELLMAMLDKSEGKWFADDGDVLFSNCAESVSIVKGVDGALYINSSSTPEIEVPINDPELIALIDEIRPKPKKKKKAQPKKKDYTGVTYMDVFDRVLDIMHNKTGYAPYDGGIEDEEHGEVDIGLDFDGWEHIVWQNVRTFLGGWTEEDDDDYEQQGIFELVADLDMRYEKLASRWYAQFCDKCRILGTVNVDDNSPAGIMKALDKAGL